MNIYQLATWCLLACTSVACTQSEQSPASMNLAQKKAEADNGTSVGKNVWLAPEPPQALMRVEYFSDTAYHRAQCYINELVDLGVVKQGPFRFMPENFVSACDFADWVYALFGKRPQSDICSANILPLQAQELLEKMTGKGWRSWMADSVSIDRPLTRAEAAEMLLRAFHDPGCYSGLVIKGDIYVSPSGSDQWSGKIAASNDALTDGPLRTPAAAIALVRALRKAQQNNIRNITILFREGTYIIDKTLNFTPEDGAADCDTIIYRNYGNERVIFSAGTRVSDWDKIEQGVVGALWRVHLPPGLPQVRQLIIDDQRMPVARYPDEGWLRITAVDNSGYPKRFELNQELPSSSLSPFAEFVDTSFWSSRRVRVDGNGQKWIRTTTHMGIAPWHMTVSVPGNTCYVENDPAFITRPWEWSLSADGNSLLLLVPDNKNPNVLSTIVPRLEQIVSICGTKDNRVKGLRFQGIEFAHTAATLPQQGISELQATFFNSRLSQIDEQPRVDLLYSLPPAIKIIYGQEIAFWGIRLKHIGNQGINFGEGVRYCSLIGSEVYDIGGTGVLVGAQEKWGRGEQATCDQDGRSDWETVSQVPYGTVIANNRISECGRIVFGGVGVWTGYTKFTKIACNDISKLPYTGISVGWSFHSGMTSSEYALIEFNHIYDVMRVLTDGGGIYVLGYQPGGIMRGNVVHDIWRNMQITGYFAHGLYFDEASRYWTVENNTVYDTYHDLKFNNYMRDSSYRNIDFDRNEILNTATTGFSGRRIGGADWLNMKNNSFGDVPQKITAGIQPVFIKEMPALCEQDKRKRFFNEPVILKKRITGYPVILNGDFEDPNLSGWTAFDTAGPAVKTAIASIVSDSPDAAGGRGFLRLSRANTYDALLSNAVVFHRDKTYCLRFAVRLFGGKPSSFRVYLDALGKEIASGIKLVPGEWVSCVYEFKVGETINSALVFQSLDVNSGTVPFDIDDVSVTIIEKPEVIWSY